MARDRKVPTGRIQRAGRLLGLGAKVGAELVGGAAGRLLGRPADPLGASAAHLYAALGDMKALALKAGQLASLFADGLPDQARAQVGRLFAAAPALPFERISEVLEAELGRPVGEVFAMLDPTPLAAASLAQVHRGQLPDGTWVAVKVQYPGVAEALAQDLDNLGAVLRTAGLGGALVETQSYVDELRREIGAELDFRRERQNLDVFRVDLAPWPELVVPRAFPELCTGRVLVLELLEGPTLADLPAPPQAEASHIARALVRAVVGPLAQARRLHGDVHPGNFIVLGDGRLGVLDLGCLKEVPAPLHQILVDLLAAMLREERVDLGAFAARIGMDVDPSRPQTAALLEELVTIVTPPFRGVHDYGRDQTFAALSRLKLRHPLELMRLRPPAQTLFVSRSMGGLLQILKGLGATFDAREVIAPLLPASRG